MNKPLYEGSEWDTDLIGKMWEVIDEVAKTTFKLDYYKPQIEIISSEQMLDAYSSVAMPIMYCVSGDTEFLTPTGWKQIKDYQEGDLVAQFNNGILEYVTPQRYIENPEEELLHFKNAGTEQLVTPNHQLVLQATRKGRVNFGNIKKIEAKEYTYNPEWGVVSTFEYNGEGLGLSENELRLIVAMKADGSIVDDKVQRFGFKKERKIERLERLLELNNVSYTKNWHSDGLCSIRTKIPNVDSKRYVWDYSKISTKDAEIIFDEIFHWDGCECYQDELIHLTFLSKYKEDTDFMQFIAALVGYRGTVIKYEGQRGYQIYFTKLNTPSLGEVVETVKGKSYCFTVPSHMWISRFNGKIAVTGNCHWSFGKTFLQNERQYHKGMQGLAYEVVINTNPCLVYLMENNTATLQALVLAHAAAGHSHFFKNNYLFKDWTDADTILDYLTFAKNYIKKCEEKYGEDKVEKILDACHSLQAHGIDKYRKSGSLKKELDEQRAANWEQYFEDSFNDLWRTIPKSKAIQFEKEERIGEENLLYFIEKNSPILEPWEREIVRIVRKIAQYFYPQRQTQLLNEGTATFFHYHIMEELHNLGYLTDGAYLEFLQSHCGVVTQLDWDHKYYSGINVYALGFAMLMDIKRICQNPDAEDRKWFPDIAGTPWLDTILNIIENYRDESFILQYLSPKVARHFKLFSIHIKEKSGHLLVNGTHDDDDFLHIRKSLAEQYDLSRSVPQIEVVDVDWKGDRWLFLEHITKNNQRLDYESMKKTVWYINRLWGFPVKMSYRDLEGNELDEV